MVLGGGADLLRDRESSQRATFLELFFDLVYVFALTRVSQRLFQDFTDRDAQMFVEAVEALLLLLSLWMLWTMTTLMTSRFDPERPAIQVVVVGTMFASMLMAVAVPGAFEGRGLAFAVPYVVAQLCRPLFLGSTLRGDNRQRISVRLVFWYALSAPLWITGALVDTETRLPLWGLAVAVDYLGHGLRWPTPRLGRAASLEWGFAGEHVAERYQQFFLIALGESILLTGLTFSAGRYSVVIVAAFTIAFLTTVLLWRIYFHQAGMALAEAITSARDPTRFTWSATYTHLAIVIGVVVTAVGYELVLGRPLGPTPVSWVGAIVSGPVLFLAGRARFEYEVFARVSWSRLAGIAALVITAPAMVLVPPIFVAIVVTVILAAIAVYDLFRAHGRAPESPASPL